MKGTERDEDLLRALDPALAAEIREAAREVDRSVIEEMRSLSLRERMAWSYGKARTLARLREEHGAY